MVTTIPVTVITTPKIGVTAFDYIDTENRRKLPENFTPEDLQKATEADLDKLLADDQYFLGGALALTDQFRDCSNVLRIYSALNTSLSDKIYEVQNQMAVEQGKGDNADAKKKVQELQADLESLRGVLESLNTSTNSLVTSLETQIQEMDTLLKNRNDTIMDIFARLFS